MIVIVNLQTFGLIRSAFDCEMTSMRAHAAFFAPAPDKELSKRFQYSSYLPTKNSEPASNPEFSESLLSLGNNVESDGALSYISCTGPLNQQSDQSRNFDIYEIAGL